MSLNFLNRFCNIFELKSPLYFNFSLNLLFFYFNINFINFYLLLYLFKLFLSLIFPIHTNDLYIPTNQLYLLPYHLNISIKILFFSKQEINQPIKSMAYIIGLILYQNHKLKSMNYYSIFLTNNILMILLFEV